MMTRKNLALAMLAVLLAHDIHVAFAAKSDGSKVRVSNISKAGHEGGFCDTCTNLLS